MIHRIYKYPVMASDLFTVSMPEGARILTVQNQGNGDNPNIWALVNPNNNPVERRFKVVATGHAIHDSIEKLSYIGTLQLMNGALVFHLFEII